MSVFIVTWLLGGLKGGCMLKTEEVVLQPIAVMFIGEAVAWAMWIERMPEVDM